MKFQESYPFRDDNKIIRNSAIFFLFWKKLSINRHNKDEKTNSNLVHYGRVGTPVSLYAFHGQNLWSYSVQMFKRFSSVCIKSKPGTGSTGQFRTLHLLDERTRQVHPSGVIFISCFIFLIFLGQCITIPHSG